MPGVFLDHEQCPEILLDAMIAEVTYELGQRDRVYPRLLEQGRSRATLEMHYARLVALKRFLERYGQLELFSGVQGGTYAPDTVRADTARQAAQKPR
jgi:hypothetical protein